MALQLFWHVIRWVVSMHFERKSVGESPWWRGALVTTNGVTFCTWGLFHTWAASLSGEVGTASAQKLVPIVVVILPMVAMGTAQLADYPLSLAGLAIIFLVGPTLQYYQTRPDHPERRFLPCFVWTIAQLVGTVGVSALLAVIVVSYRLLVASRQLVLASFFLPVCTALVETGGVLYTKILYARLVVQKRPFVPGDISWSAMIYMITGSHAFSEGARLVAVFSGAVSTGAYGWVGSLAATLVLNVLVRSGWLRYGCYCMAKKIVGTERAFHALAPTAWSKLHDEMKIYGGYFRFIVVLSLVLARALVYQEASTGRSPSFNTSAAWALVSMLLMEYLEDHIVLWEVVPMSPTTSELVDEEVHRAAHVGQGALISLDLKSAQSAGPWCLDELDDNGFKLVNRAQPSSSALQLDRASDKKAVKCSSIVPVSPEGGEESGSESAFREPALTLSDARPPRPLNKSSGSSAVPQMVSHPETGRAAQEDAQQVDQQPEQPAPACVPPPMQELRMLDMEAEMLGQPCLQASLGPLRTSTPSRVRRWFGQQRHVVPSLLLHGLREMPWFVQLSAVGITCEVTLGFLNTTLGPGYLRGMITEPCQDFDALVVLWWPTPLVC